LQLAYRAPSTRLRWHANHLPPLSWLDTPTCDISQRRPGNNPAICSSQDHQHTAIARLSIESFPVPPRATSCSQGLELPTHCILSCAPPPSAPGKTFHLSLSSPTTHPSHLTPWSSINPSQLPVPPSPTSTLPPHTRHFNLPRHTLPLFPSSPLPSPFAEFPRIPRPMPMPMPMPMPTPIPIPIATLAMRNVRCWEDCETEQAGSGERVPVSEAASGVRVWNVECGVWSVEGAVVWLCGYDKWYERDAGGMGCVWKGRGEMAEDVGGCRDG
jgi:hypothetical protein